MIKLIQKFKLPAVLLFVFLSTQNCSLRAQSIPGKELKFGIEQDFLPYLTGGWFAGAWAGTDKYRIRIITARVKKPKIIIPEGFKNNWVNAYALLIDYSLNDSWKKWWIGAGTVFWDSEIETDQVISSNTSYQNFLLSGNLGYNWSFKSGFYISPWVGLHIKLAGDHTITIANDSFSTPFLNPEASLKIGWSFL